MYVVHTYIYRGTMLVCTLFTRRYIIREYFLTYYILRSRTLWLFTDYFFMYSCRPLVPTIHFSGKLKIHFSSIGNLFLERITYVFGHKKLSTISIFWFLFPLPFDFRRILFDPIVLLYSFHLHALVGGYCSTFFLPLSLFWFCSYSLLVLLCSIYDLYFLSFRSLPPHSLPSDRQKFVINISWFFKNIRIRVLTSNGWRTKSIFLYFDFMTGYRAPLVTNLPRVETDTSSNSTFRRRSCILIRFGLFLTYHFFIS